MTRPTRTIMAEKSPKHPSTFMVVLAFSIVYLVWGSTYFFIKVAIAHLPAMLMASMRFLAAGLLMFIWCLARGEAMFVVQNIKPAIITGILLLFLANGAVVWAEKYLPSSLVAVITSASPIWFVVLDRRLWPVNLSSRETVLGLVTGFLGVVLLFGENARHSLASTGQGMQVIALGILVLGSMCWASGSLFSKYHSKGKSNSANAAWQMIAAGLAFIFVSFLSGEWNGFTFQSVPSSSWMALLYLIVLGSLAGYTAFIWLLQVRPATQVSTHAYVNPVVAVLLGISLAGEKMSYVQWIGLALVLSSVLMINLARYRREQNLSRQGMRQGQP
jgi:drug/metabolite transporter (DMT)-like permease